MNLVFTICSNNYFAQAIILGHTLIKHNPGYTFKVGLVDKKNEQIDYSKYPFEVLEVEDIGIPEFEDMAMRYDIVELNTAVKPFYFKFFLGKGQYERLIYMDPDIEVFAPFTELANKLSTHEIVITPHFFSPINDDKWQAEEDFLNAGIYNLGFIAIKDTPNTRKMIEWWAERLKSKAYINFSKGMFTDQIWIMFVPLYFEKVHILRHLGYNVAYWNLHERVLCSKGGKYYINDIIELVFYHYASYRPLTPDRISTGQSRFSFESRKDIADLFRNYNRLLFDAGYKEFAAINCIYVTKREEILREVYFHRLKKYPLHKKILGKLTRWLINSFALTLDYKNLK